MIEKITMKEWLSRRVPKVKSSSLKTYRSYERAHILPSLGNIPISEVGAMLPAFSVQLAERLAHKTVRDILTYVHTILREAEAKGLAEASNMPKITMEPKEKEVLTYSEQKALTARLRQSAAPLDMAVLLALATGLRLGEVAGLRHKDFVLEAAVLRVRRNSQRVYDGHDGHTPLKNTTPKTRRSRRDIPLPRAFVAVLARYMEDREGQPAAAPLIAAPGGSAYDPRTIERRFDKLKAEHGLSSGVTFHSLRHSFATRALEAGADMRTVSDLLGHSSVAFTMNCYSHSATKLKREQMEKINEYF